jgi:acyl transferase domain-containing protein
LKDKDQIYAVIRGTGVAHGGKGMSMTAPSAAGNKGCNAAGLPCLDIDPRTVSYIEAHGIGSPLGDGIEINALKQGLRNFPLKYQKNTQEDPTCFIGNINDPSAMEKYFRGCSLMKVIFSIRHKMMLVYPIYKAS